jgi:hypothetical protein
MCWNCVSTTLTPTQWWSCARVDAWELAVPPHTCNGAPCTTNAERARPSYLKAYRTGLVDRCHRKPYMTTLPLVTATFTLP